MRKTVILLLLAMGLSGMPLAAAGSNVVKDLVDAGEILPFESIKNHVVAQVQGEFIGAEFDVPTLRYRFRFLVNGTVVNVDVDARTGKRFGTRQSY